MSDVVFADKFIGFVDILGFKKVVEAAEAGDTATLTEAHCWDFVLCLLQKGMMCRGFITRGRISHESDMDFVGTGAHRAFENEKNVAAFRRDAREQGTPFVEIDHIVCDYVNNCGDWCVKEMASRFASFDGKVVALFPFKRLAHQFMIGRGVFDVNRERESNHNVRLILTNLKERVSALVDPSNPRAVCKARHYIEALDTQLAICDSTDDLIRLLSQ